jgi:hypothetical protein
VDHRSFRDQLAFSIGFAVTRSGDLLRRLLKDHVTDDARQILAERVVEQLEQSGFEIDERAPSAQEEPARTSAPNAGRVAVASAPSRFSSALARISFLAAAFSTVRVARRRILKPHVGAGGTPQAI